MTKKNGMYKRNATLSFIVFIFLIVSAIFLLTNYIHPIFIIFFGMVIWNFLVATGYIQPFGEKKRKRGGQFHSKKGKNTPKKRKEYTDLEWALKIFGMQKHDLTKESVKKRFYLLARENHPDIVENPKISMYDITKAYEILSKAAL